MTSDAPWAWRLCVGVDIERYSQRDARSQDKVQRDLTELLNRVYKSAGIDRERTDKQAQGDAELAILPADIDLSRAIAELIRELLIELRQHNEPLKESNRLRLRVAFHGGLARVGYNGFPGQAAVTTCRLRDAKELKTALKQARRAEAAFIASDLLYQDVLAQGFRGLPAEAFHRVEVIEDDKDFASYAWIYVPDVPPPPFPPRRVADRPRDDGPRLPGGNVVINTADGDAAGRDITKINFGPDR